ncbi:hypothetical protein M513_08959 [Trichuris suis]|uniref:Uncharacterized protein n=1 Tax=Trichuris suis TaxID=68888 RepID=A0A085LZ18_9BILA|nr:hypothetical protein M513_08959 [Trichuris suis]
MIENAISYDITSMNATIFHGCFVVNWKEEECSNLSELTASTKFDKDKVEKIMNTKTVQQRTPPLEWSIIGRLNDQAKGHCTYLVFVAKRP